MPADITLRVVGFEKQAAESLEHGGTPKLENGHSEERRGHFAVTRHETFISNHLREVTRG